jgi:hypothetical protein
MFFHPSGVSFYFHTQRQFSFAHAERPIKFKNDIHGKMGGLRTSNSTFETGITLAPNGKAPY